MLLRSAQDAVLSSPRSVTLPRRSVARELLKSFALAALLLSQTGVAASVSIQLDNGAFKVTGWTTPEPVGGWASIFTVSTGRDLPPLFGAYSMEGGSLTFHPRYPLASGVTYYAVFHPPGSAPVEATFHGP